MAWYHRFSDLFRRGTLDREIDDELITHIAQLPTNSSSKE